MKCSSTFSCLLIILGIIMARAEPGSPVTYPAAVNAYLKRVQQGRQAHAFEGTKDFGQWQASARSALIDLIGLKQMQEELAGFLPKVLIGKAKASGVSFTRALCSIETEPGVKVPFYLLVPKTSNPEKPAPLFLAPHGHDVLGLHSYAGAFCDEAHRKKVMAKQGNIAEQAAKRGFIAIAPATRGLATEVSIPDPRGRHGNRPCRAQLMHCLVAGRTPIAERVWDMRRLLDWAEKDPRVDATRIVMAGNSGGGVLTAYTAAIDTRVSVAAPSCSFAPVIDTGGYIFHCDCCMVPGLRNWGDWPELGGLIAPRELLIVHGVEDSLHHRPTIEKLFSRVHRIYRAAGVPGRATLSWGKSGHRFYPDLMWPVIGKALREAGH
jgi:dienelactone hydrolase